MLIAFVIAPPRSRSYTLSCAVGRGGGVLIIERCVRREGRTVLE